MATAIGSVFVNLGLNTAQFQQGLKGVSGQLSGLGKRMQGIGEAMSLAVSVPLAGVGAGIVRVAGDFEASMNRVRAALGSSDAEFAALREQAKQMGATTQFSASEAADAIEILAKNGLSASQILGGALQASLTLAASSGTDLAGAGDLATDVMLNFGKQAQDLAGVVDGVAGTLLESKFGFDDYRLAIAQAGGVAGGLGVEFSEFNAVIAATSEAFSSGSDAGTAFRTFLTRLTPASKEAAATMQELGLQFFNADGSMKGMAEVAQELQDAFSGLSEEARTAALTDIFGQDAMRTAIGLMQEGASGVQALDAAIRGASATEQAAARMQGFSGAMKEMQSALEGLALAIADAGLIQWTTDMVKWLTDIVRTLSETNPEILRWGTILGGVAVVIGPLVATLGLFVAGIAAIGAPALAAAAALTAIATAVVVFRDEIQAALDQVVASVEEFRTNVLAAFSGSEEAMREVGSDMMSGLSSGMRLGMGGPIGLAGEIGRALAGRMMEVLGVRSPSTVFRGIGEQSMEGLALGFEAGSPRATGAARQTIDDILAETGRLRIDLPEQSRITVESVGFHFSGILDPLKETLRKGELSFGSFADAMVGIANRMTDRLLDDAFRRLEDGIASAIFGGGRGGGGGLFGALFGSLAGAGASSFAGGGFGSVFSGVYAGGGFIPSGRFGLVGEAGPEFVHGPASVISAADTDRMLGGGVTIHSPVSISGAHTITRRELDETLARRNRQLAAQVAEQNRRGLGK